MRYRDRPLGEQVVVPGPPDDGALTQSPALASWCPHDRLRDALIGVLVCEAGRAFERGDALAFYGVLHALEEAARLPPRRS